MLQLILTRFPEQFKFGVQPWQAKRLLWNTFNFGGTNTLSDDQFKINVGVFNPVLGKSIGEIASDSRSQHKSQGFGVPAIRGEQWDYLKITEGPAPRKDLMEDINTGWSRVEGAAGIEAQVNELITKFNSTDPSASVEGLVRLYHSVSGLKDEYWKTKKLGEIQQLIEACSGLYMEAWVENEYAVPGDTIEVGFLVNSRNAALNILGRVSMEGFDSSFHDTLRTNLNVHFSKMILVSRQKNLSQPYWLDQPMAKGSYTVNDQIMIGKPENDPSYLARFIIKIDGTEFQFEKPVRYKFRDPVKGEVIQPLFVVPRIAVKASPAILVLPENKQIPSVISVSPTANTNLNSQEVGFSGLISGNEVFHVNRILDLSKGKTKPFEFQVPSSSLGHSEKSELNTALKTAGGSTDELAIGAINYDHIPSIRYFYKDKVSVLNINLKTDGKSIGYIRGAGDKVPEALQQMGYNVTFLEEKDLKVSRLAQFDAIVMGVRAYNVHEWLDNGYDALMDYVKGGGNLVVQFNTNSFTGPLGKVRMGPFPFAISRLRVTDEEAQVSFLDSANLVLNWPNKITTKILKDGSRRGPFIVPIAGTVPIRPF